MRSPSPRCSSVGLKDEIVARVSAVLDLMQLAHLRSRPPHRLSGGEKKRVALASVLVLDPEVLLLDEPTAGLDPRSESQIIDMLIAWGDGTRTVITATHDLGLVEDIADHCVVLYEGKVAAEGEPAQLLRDHALLSRTNMVHAHRHRHASGVTHSRIRTLIPTGTISAAPFLSLHLRQHVRAFRNHGNPRPRA